ncbi:MAG: hypothetical protein AAGL34_04350 [Bacteroidota bacterium]
MKSTRTEYFCTMVKNYVVLFTISLFLLTGSTAQEIKVFKLEDFELKGKVHVCLVVTDYGNESFEFDESGRLVKTITQYNDSDQDVTLYKYEDGFLVEKRMESYKDGVIDEATSMANFYEHGEGDTQKVIEKIISYDKEFLEQQEHQYDAAGKLAKVITSNANGVDETIYEYNTYKNETTASQYTNEIIQKSVRTSQRKMRSGTQTVVLTKDFVDGTPQTAVEEIKNENGRLLSKQYFLFDTETKQFAPDRKMSFLYDAEGMLTKEITQTENSKSVREYIYQFDNGSPKNWIKQIITPDNSYTTRKITYYPEETE